MPELNYPDAIVNATMVKIVKPKEDATKVQILASTDRDIPVGKTYWWHGRFHNYIGIGQERVAQQLKKAGLTVVPQLNRRGEIVGIGMVKYITPVIEDSK